MLQEGLQLRKTINLYVFQGNTAAMIAIEMGNDKLANYLNGTYVEPVLTLVLMMDLPEEQFRIDRAIQYK